MPWRLCLVGALLASPPGAAVPVPIHELRGVVGDTVSVSLPAKDGTHWEWRSTDHDELFSSPYHMRFQPSPSSKQGLAEIWVFPLMRPGETLLEFVQTPPTEGQGASLAPSQRVHLRILTPYEAQQHPLSYLLDALLIH